MWKNELDNAKNCLAAGDVNGALSAYQRFARELGGEDMKEKDIDLAVRACSYFIASQTGKISEIELAGRELDGALYCCFSAALAFTKRDLAMEKQYSLMAGFATKDMSDKELVLAGRFDRKIGSLDAESVLYLGGLVYNAVKFPLKLLQLGDSKRTMFSRQETASRMRDYMLICMDVYLEKMGLDDAMRRRLYLQIANLDAFSPKNETYILFGENEKNLSVSKKMSEIYKYLHIMNPRIARLLLVLLAVLAGAALPFFAF